MERYITCKQCWKQQKNAPVLATVNDFGVVRVKRYHRGETIIFGANIMVTCGKCQESIVIRVNQQSQKKQETIAGTLLIENNNFSYLWA